MMWSLGGWWMMAWMVAFWIVVVGVTLWLLSRLFPATRAQATGQPSAPHETSHGAAPQALDILDERYARGEIDRAQYEQMRADLLS